MIRKILGVAIFLMLAACNLSGQQKTSKPQTWFDMPLPDTVFYPPNPCRVLAHGASPNGIALFELSINNNVIANIPNSDSQTTLATLQDECSPLQPGKNLLALRAQDRAGVWSEYAETTVILDVSNVPPTETETDSPRVTDTPAPTATATLIPTLTPTLAPVIGPPDELSITAVSTWVVYVGNPSCGPMETVVTAHALASKGIAAVFLFFRFPGMDFQNVSMSSAGNDLYQGTISMPSLFGNSIPFDQAILEYQVVVQQSDGDISLRTPVLADIEARACSSAGGSGSPDVCSAFVDQRACIANGCNWWEIPGSPPTFVCRSKP